MGNAKIINTKRLVESGLLIAIGFILSLIEIWQLPYGGSVTICSMLPVILLSYRYGVKWGVFCGFTASLLQLAFGAAKGSLKGYELWVLIAIILLDYIIAYTVVGFGGMFRNKFTNKPALGLALGAFVVLIARFMVHIVSGYLLFGSYAEWFFVESGFPYGETIMNTFSGNGLSFIYSLIYNATYMIPELIITTVVAAIIGAIPSINKKLA